jgi:hypothetical protein
MIIEKEIARGGFGRVERVRMPDGTVLAKKLFLPQWLCHRLQNMKS